MKLPPLHNTRAPQQWEIISKHVDFEGKTVLDLGCGYGDILLICFQSGAKCVGIENNFLVFQEAITKIPVVNSDILLLHWDISDWINNNSARNHDVIICFSVLPYLDNPYAVLEWIKAHSEIALIEIQLFGDGPGSNNWLKGQINDNPEVTYLVDKEDTYTLLRTIGWKHIYDIGGTTVKKDRDYERTIWLCQ